MDEKNQEYPQQNDPVLPEEGLDLDAIMKEFSPEEASEAEDFADVPQEDIPEPEELPQEMYPSDEAFEEFLYDAPSEEAQLQGSPVTDDTVRIELAPSKRKIPNWATPFAWTMWSRL